MSEKAGIRKEFEKPFLLDEAKLRKICEVLREHAKKLDFPTYLKFYVERTDDSFYETRDIDTVLADDNVDAKTVRTVSIELNKDAEDGDDLKKVDADKFSSLAYVAFRTKKTPHALFFVTTETREWCFLLADELETQIKRTLRKKPISFISHSTIDGIFIVTIFLLALHYLPGLVFNTPHYDITPQQIIQMSQEDILRKTLEVVVTKQNSSGTSFYSLVFIIVGLMILIEKLPMPSKIISQCSQAVFYWGDAIQRHEKFERTFSRVKWGLIIAFGVSLLATLVGAVILKS